jgi:hypothetical protein
MKVSRRIAAREVSQLVAVVGAPAALPESSRAASSSWPLTDTETKAILGGELLAALSGASPRA